MINKQLEEIFNFYKEDCTYVALTDLVEEKDIHKSLYKKQIVEGKSFDHEFTASSLQPYSDDCYNGTSFIPVGDGMYLRIDWAS